MAQGKRSPIDNVQDVVVCSQTCEAYACEIYGCCDHKPGMGKNWFPEPGAKINIIVTEPKRFSDLEEGEKQDYTDATERSRSDIQSINSTSCGGAK